MKKMCKVDEVFLFILEKSKGENCNKVPILEIKNHFGFKKTTMNNYLQVLFRYGVVNRENSLGKTGYYSAATKVQYFDYVKKKRNRKFNCGKHLIDKTIYDFIYSGCPERIGKNLNAFV